MERTISLVENSVATLLNVGTSIHDYVFRFHVIDEKLEEMKGKLIRARARLQHEIEEAERQLLRIEDDVQDLQSKVDCTIQAVDKLETEILNQHDKRCLNWFPNWSGRYRLSKKAMKMTMDISELLEKMSKFGQPGRIAYYERQQAPVEAGVDMEAAPEEQTIERIIELLLDEKPARFSSQMLQSFTSNYSTKLGEGGYGVVYKGHLPDGRPLAVKVLGNYGAGERIKEQFMAEVNTIGRTHHRNLVRLFGFCFESKKKALVYEFMENGSLDKLLFENKHEIKWDKLYEIAIGAARGLEYLHHFTLKKIIHYDIKPANVLLASDYSPKNADFGLAKLCNRDTTNITMSRVRGTPGYAAPEIWMPFPVSYKCDVYSFGVMLFEMVGRRRNFVCESEEWFPKQVWKKFDKGELEEIWDSCEIEGKDREKAKTMVSVALWCIQYLPDARPSMREVVKILEGGAEAATPPNPFPHLTPSVNALPCIVSGSDSTTDYEKYEIQYATS